MLDDWTDLEDVNIGLLFDIYKVELLNKYQSPFSPTRLNILMNLMQNDKKLI